MAGVAAGFPPVAGADARALILGSLPGARSIAAQEYYAHPRNAFWPIMAELFGIEGCYAARCQQLIDQRLALWDVLARSRRPGSMDANIRVDASVANDLEGFLGEHRHVQLVVCNGRTSEQLFRRFFADTPLMRRVAVVGAPSTSPAYAAMPITVKLERWSKALGPVMPHRSEAL